MKQKIDIAISMTKHVIKRAIQFTLILAAFVALVIFAWELTPARDSVVTIFDSEPIVYERTPEEVSEFELYVASQEVQQELKLMYMKHQRQVLDEQIAAQQGF